MLLRPEISGNLFLLENNGTHFGRFFFFGIVVCHGTPKRKNQKFPVEFSRFKCLIKHRNTCRCVLSADSSASCGTWDCGGSTGCPDDDAGCQAATSGGCSCCWPPDVQAIKRPQPPYDDGFCGKKKKRRPPEQNSKMADFVSVCSAFLSNSSLLPCRGSLFSSNHPPEPSTPFMEQRPFSSIHLFRLVIHRGSG